MRLSNGRIIYRFLPVMLLLAATLLFTSVALVLPRMSSAQAQTTEQTDSETTHTVQIGDTLSNIGRRYDVTVQHIAPANNLVNLNLIFVGQQLVIPVPAPPAAPTDSPIDSPTDAAPPTPPPSVTPSPTTLSTSAPPPTPPLSTTPAIPATASSLRC